MKITISVWERMMLIKVVGALQGPVGMVKQAMQALDVLQLSDEEKTKIGLLQKQDGTLAWDDCGETFELAFEESLYHLICQAAHVFKYWPAAQGKAVLALLEKLIPSG